MTRSPGTARVVSTACSGARFTMRIGYTSYDALSKTVMIPLLQVLGFFFTLPD